MIIVGMNQPSTSSYVTISRIKELIREHQKSSDGIKRSFKSPALLIYADRITDIAKRAITIGTTYLISKPVKMEMLKDALCKSGILQRTKDKEGAKDKCLSDRDNQV